MSTEETLDSGSGTGNIFTDAMKKDLRVAGGWAQFMAVLGFIGVGFMILGALMMLLMGGNAASMPGNNLPSGMNPAIFGLIYLVVAILYLIPLIYLNRFATNSKSAGRSGSTTDLREAIKQIRKHYQFIGIFTIVIISIYILLFFFVIASGAAA